MGEYKDNEPKVKMPYQSPAEAFGFPPYGNTKIIHVYKDKHYESVSS